MLNSSINIKPIREAPDQLFWIPSYDYYNNSFVVGIKPMKFPVFFHDPPLTQHLGKMKILILLRVLIENYMRYVKFIGNLMNLLNLQTNLLKLI